MFKSIISKLVGEPAVKAYATFAENKRQQRAAKAKLEQTKVTGAQEVVFNDQELEHLLVKGQDKTWKDEYTLVSVVCILNGYVVASVAHAFGAPRLLEGMNLAMTSLNEQGVDMGLLLTAAVASGLGVSLYRMLRL